MAMQWGNNGNSMTTITLDDQLINEVVAVGHYQSSQETVLHILADYLRQRKNEQLLFDQLRLADDVADDDLALLFERDKDTGRTIKL